ncbi:MAG TPA: RnfABCDGE type electron transport complex subunit G [Lachnospiraceae bacterium]|nr:RnfABCDGE type electron transport complex subunit G [Lachnospiraceae bacterium]
MKNQVVKDAVIITLITLVAGILLGLVHGITAAPIAAEEEKTRNNACKAVFEAASTFDEAQYDAKAVAEALTKGGITKTKINSIAEAKDSSGASLGYVVDVTNTEGYGGDIELMAGITSDGTINGIQFLSISETAGMGMKAKDADFMDQFKGLKADQVKWTKSGKTSDDEIDAISGATVTTKAVTKAVNGALLACQYMEAQK